MPHFFEAASPISSLPTTAPEEFPYDPITPSSSCSVAVEMVESQYPLSAASPRMDADEDRTISYAYRTYARRKFQPRRRVSKLLVGGRKVFLENRFGHHLLVTLPTVLHRCLSRFQREKSYFRTSSWEVPEGFASREHPPPPLRDVLRLLHWVEDHVDMVPEL